MLNKLKNSVITKSGLLVITIMMLFSAYLMPVYAQCPDNVVPNPLDPECTLATNNRTITIGFLINRFIVFLPYIVTVLAVAAFAWGAIKIIMAGDGEGREEGIKIMINAGIGLGLFFSIWLILFIISIVTGYDLLAAIGQ